MTPSQMAALRLNDLNQLTVLFALLTTQSVTRAAEQLNLTQPALSKSLDRLRHQFDDPLLVRDGNRMRLTPCAQGLLPAVGAAIDQVSAVFSMRGPFEPRLARGRLRIGANDYVQLVLCGRLLRLLRERAPLVTVEFRPVGIGHPEQLLADGFVDLAIGANLLNIALRWQSLYADPFVCVVGPDSSSIPDRLTLEGFCELPHVDVSPSGTGLLGELIDRALAELGGQRNVRHRCSSFMAVPAMLAGTGLAALVPRQVQALFPLGSVRVVDLEFDLPPYEVSLWWHNATNADPLASWVRCQLVELSRETERPPTLHAAE